MCLFDTGPVQLLWVCCCSVLLPCFYSEKINFNGRNGTLFINTNETFKLDDDANKIYNIYRLYND